MLDEAGQPLIIYFMRGNSTRSNRRMPIEDGQGAVMSTAGTARTVVLCKDGQEISRIAVTLQSEGITVLRP